MGLDVERIRAGMASLRASTPASDGPEIDAIPATMATLTKEKKRYLKGPVPLDWLTRAAELPGSAVKVGLAIWYLAGRQRSKTVRLTNTILDNFGVDRQGKYRALKALAEARLIDYQGEHGKNPAVTILEIKNEEHKDHEY